MLTESLLLFVLIAPLGSTDLSPSSICTPGRAAAGLCTATSDGTQVDLGASLGGGPGVGSDGDGGGNAGEWDGAEGDAEEATPDCMPGFCDRGNYDVFVYPTVTAEDLVSFRPVGPSIGNEPAGFAVVGLPTNVYAAASEQTMTGELLGHDVAVRFVPVAFEFDYGDGTTSTSASGGAPWRTSGAPQFSPTETGHTYRQRGVHTVTATVVFDATVDWGHGWRPVTGSVRAHSGAHVVEVLEARTALVDRSCAESPGGPGC